MPKTHIVKDGEYLTLIARTYGFVTNKALLDANADLFEERRDPNVLNPGDELIIPDKRVKLLPRATEQVHSFRLKQQEDWLRLVIKDDQERPLPDQSFTLRVQTAGDAREDSGLELKGRLSGGRLDVLLPPGATRARLVLDEMPWLSWKLLVGHMDPTHDPVDKKTIVKGVQARLNNLGFFCGKVDGVMGPKTKAAIAWFQGKKMSRQNPTGKLDDDTREALESAHGF